MKGDMYIISAPSGTGKTTIIRTLLKIVPGLFFSISYTTRTPRPKEINGKDYFFVSESEFKKLLDENALMEYAKVHDFYYGTAKEQVLPLIEKGFDVILDIDVQGALHVKQNYLEAIMIFILPPSGEELKKRLDRRKTNSEKEKQLRLENAKNELKYWRFYDFLVVNQYLEQTINQIKSIIIAHRCRRTKKEEYFSSIVEPIISSF